MKRKNNKILFFGFSIPTVCKQTGYPSVTVWRHANGLRKISAEAAIKYSVCLGIPLSELRPDLWPPEPAPEREEVSA